jgi:hypothetical protein
VADATNVSMLGLPSAPNLHVTSAPNFQWPARCIRCDAPQTTVRGLDATPRFIPWLPFAFSIGVPVCERCDDAFAIRRAKAIGIGALVFVGTLALAALTPLACLIGPFEVVAFLGFDRWFETRFFGFRAWCHFTTPGFDAWVSRPALLETLREAAARPYTRPRN